VVGGSVRVGAGLCVVSVCPVPEKTTFPIPISDNKAPIGFPGRAAVGKAGIKGRVVCSKEFTSSPDNNPGRTPPGNKSDSMPDSEPNVTSGGASCGEETAPGPGSRLLNSPSMRPSGRPDGDEKAAAVGGVMPASIFDTKLSIKADDALEFARPETRLLTTPSTTLFRVVLGLTVVGRSELGASPESSPLVTSGRGVELPDEVSVCVPAGAARPDPKALNSPSTRSSTRPALLVALGD
jgi:hypothetical protein